MADEKILPLNNMNQEYSNLEAQESAEEYLSHHSHHWANSDKSAISPNVGDLTTEENCKKFSECLKTLTIKEIGLYSNESLILVTAENWQLIGKHLQNSPIQKVSLVKTSLEQFNLASLNVFLNICFSAPHVKYSFINFSLFGSEPAKWTAFCHAIATSKSTEVCFEGCQLSQLNSQQREEFLEALKLSTIKKFDILQDAVSQTFKNDLDEILQKNQKQKEIQAVEYLEKHSHYFIGFKNPEFKPNIDDLTTEENCKQFADCLKTLDVKKILFDSREDFIYLTEVTAENWQLIGKHLSDSPIQKIELVQICLDKFKTDSLQAFLDICFKLSDVKFCFIDISAIAKIPAQWNVFCNALSASSSNTICFDGSRLNTLNPQQQQEFLEALKCSSITHIEISRDLISEKFQHEILKILRKNQASKDLKDKNGLFKMVARQLLWENPQGQQPRTSPRTKTEIDPHNKIPDEVYQKAVADTKDRQCLTMTYFR